MLTNAAALFHSLIRISYQMSRGKHDSNFQLKSGYVSEPAKGLYTKRIVCPRPLLLIDDITRKRRNSASASLVETLTFYVKI